jgi:excisionase family DNA binding protein
VPDTLDQHQDILTTGEAAALCGVSRSTLRRAVAQGQIRAWHTPGKHLRFTRSTCEEFAHSLGRIDVVGRPHRESRQSAPTEEQAVQGSPLRVSV